MKIQAAGATDFIASAVTRHTLRNGAGYRLGLAQ